MIKNNCKLIANLYVWGFISLMSAVFPAFGQTFNVVPGNYYYDNSLTKWSAPQYVCGNALSVKQYAMTRVGSSDIWVYERTVSGNTWNGATAAYFVASPLSPVPSNIADVATADVLKSSIITKATVGQLYKTDGTLQLIDVFIKHAWSSQTPSYIKATKISDTEWSYTGKYGSGEYYISTNDASLGSSATGVGVYEVNITPLVMGGPYSPIQDVLLHYTTSENPMQPLASDKIVISASENDDLSVMFTEHPQENRKVYTGTSYVFGGLCSKEATLSIYLNDVLQKSIVGTTISQTVVFPQVGMNKVKVTAVAGDESAESVLSFNVLNKPVEDPRPAGLVRGANYIDDNTVTLLFYAPNKEFVYVVSELSNWQTQQGYLMKKDGDYFWMTLTGLTKQKEYAYYYAIDNEVNVPDPYTRKALEKNFDGNISPDIYPDLMPFPSGCKEKVVSIFQTAQPVDYEWQCNDFVAPPQRQLSIYEILVRDYTNDVQGGKNYYGNLNGVIEKLDYIKSLGINAVELMPMIYEDSSPNDDGSINWGYHTIFFFAPNKHYGTSADHKRFVDECHKRGLAVILDIQLDHAWGLCPLVRMYADPVGNNSAKPASDNPWFNKVSPNPNYFYGADFNHESPDTKELMEEIVQYWLREYRYDGYRFDFSKGLTQTPGEGTAYDAKRIATIKNFADKMWEVNPNAYVILEHFCDNNEEIELASYRNGMMPWGKQYSSYMNAIIGNSGSSSGFSAGTSAGKGWPVNNRLLYMESHDEERVAYAAANNGVAKNNLAYRMKRCGLAAAFLFCSPGPRMMWEFGEVGYDYSLLYSSTSQNLEKGQEGDAKPPRWDYFDEPERQQLLNIYRKILNFRKTYGNAIEKGTYKGEVDSWPIRKITIEHQDINFTLIGNFGETASTQTTPSGTWYDLFSGNKQNGMFLIQPGEFKLLTNKVVTSVSSPETEIEWWGYPNPAVDKLYIHSPKSIASVEIISLDGRVISRLSMTDNVVDVSVLPKAMYLLRITDTERMNHTIRFIKQ